MVGPALAGVLYDVRQFEFQILFKLFCRLFLTRDGSIIDIIGL